MTNLGSLDPFVLIVGVTCLAFFIIWLLGRKAESLQDAFDSLPAALVAFGALCAAPFFFYMTWHQIGAKSRLQQENLPVCAALGHAVGAQGGRAPYFVWRFEALDDPGIILAYYENHAAKDGWKVERKKNGMLLRKPGTLMAIWSEKQGDKEQIVIQKNPRLP